MSVATTSFRAMNSDILVLSPDGGQEYVHAVDAVRHTFEIVERCLSRFRADSELSALNRSNGEPFGASPLLFRAISLALDAAAATDGVFDPTILSDLEAAGYDRSFELGPGTGVDRTAPRRQRTDYRSISLDATTSTIRLTGGVWTGLDLGGIGKGLAVDLSLDATGSLPNRCINAGGDLAVRGSANSEAGWTVALEDAGRDAPIAVQLCDCALATSTTVKRRWTVAGESHHHLIDPHTGRPSTSPLRTVTVVAPHCVQADVAAKAALLQGDLAFIDKRGLHGFAVTLDGSTVRTAQWPQVRRLEAVQR